jgi:hypothetical protein
MPLLILICVAILIAQWRYLQGRTRSRLTMKADAKTRDGALVAPRGWNPGAVRGALATSLLAAPKPAPAVARDQRYARGPDPRREWDEMQRMRDEQYERERMDEQWRLDRTRR